MFSVQVEATKFIEYLGNFTEKFRVAALTEADSTLGAIRREMQVPGSPVTYPVQWDNEKQRRFVMAKLRRENNLPYKRTGAYVNGWSIQLIPNGVSISNAPPAGAIGGTIGTQGAAIASLDSLSTWQSNIHGGRWKLIVDVMKEKLAGFNTRVVMRLSKNK